MITIEEDVLLKCLRATQERWPKGGLRGCRAEVAVLGGLAVWQEEPTKRLARKAHSVEDLPKI